MTNHKTLADTWRAMGADPQFPLYTPAIVDLFARQVEGLLPVWKTLDPLDESTWPDDGIVYLVSTRGTEEFAEWQKAGHGFDVFSCDGWIGINDCVIKYRERCDLDYPPWQDNGSQK